MGAAADATAIGDVPDGAAAHHHVAGGGADGTGPGSHLVGAVEDHAFRSEPVDVGRLEDGVGPVDLQVERRLVVDDDEQDVGAFVGGGAFGRAQEGQAAGDHGGQRHEGRADHGAESPLPGDRIVRENEHRAYAGHARNACV